MKKIVSILLSVLITAAIPVQVLCRITVDVSLPINRFGVSASKSPESSMLAELLTDTRTSKAEFQSAVKLHIDEMFDLITASVTQRYAKSSVPVRDKAVKDAQATFLQETLTVLYQEGRRLEFGKETGMGPGLDKVISRIALTENIVKSKQGSLGLTPAVAAPQTKPWYKRYATALKVLGVSGALLAGALVIRHIRKDKGGTGKGGNGGSGNGNGPGGQALTAEQQKELTDLRDHISFVRAEFGEINGRLQNRLPEVMLPGKLYESNDINVLKSVLAASQANLERAREQQRQEQQPTDGGEGGGQTDDEQRLADQEEQQRVFRQEIDRLLAPARHARDAYATYRGELGLERVLPGIDLQRFATLEEITEQDVTDLSEQNSRLRAAMNQAYQAIEERNRQVEREAAAAEAAQAAREEELARQREEAAAAEAYAAQEEELARQREEAQAAEEESRRQWLQELRRQQEELQRQQDEERRQQEAARAEAERQEREAAEQYEREQAQRTREFLLEKIGGFDERIRTAHAAHDTALLNSVVDDMRTMRRRYRDGHQEQLRKYNLDVEDEFNRRLEQLYRMVNQWFMESYEQRLVSQDTTLDKVREDIGNISRVVTDRERIKIRREFEPDPREGDIIIEVFSDYVERARERERELEARELEERVQKHAQTLEEQEHTVATLEQEQNPTYDQSDRIIRAITREKPYKGFHTVLDPENERFYNALDELEKRARIVRYKVLLAGQRNKSSQDIESSLGTMRRNVLVEGMSAETKDKFDELVRQYEALYQERVTAEKQALQEQRAAKIAGFEEELADVQREYQHWNLLSKKVGDELESYKLKSDESDEAQVYRERLKTLHFQARDQEEKRRFSELESELVGKEGRDLERHIKAIETKLGLLPDDSPNIEAFQQLVQRAKDLKKQKFQKYLDEKLADYKRTIATTDNPQGVLAGIRRQIGFYSHATDPVERAYRKELEMLALQLDETIRSQTQAQ